MDYLYIITDLIKEYWQTILIGLIIALGVGFFFFVLTPWGIKKFLKTAEVERRNRAKENILDLLESSLIFKQDMDLIKILHLVNAIGREYDVDVSTYFTTKNLLEDLELRFEKSKHLDSIQKQEYTRNIESLINDLEEQEKEGEISIPYDDLLKKIETNINEENKELALKNIGILRKELIYTREEYSLLDSILLEYIRIFKKIANMPESTKYIVILIYILMIIFIITIQLKTSI